MMCNNFEFIRLNNFTEQYYKEYKALSRQIREYKKAYKIAHDNYLSFKKERNIFICEHLSDFLRELSPEGEIIEINVLFEPTKILSVTKVINNQHKILEYDTENGWNETPSNESIRDDSEIQQNEEISSESMFEEW